MPTHIPPDSSFAVTIVNHMKVTSCDNIIIHTQLYMIFALQYDNLYCKQHGGKGVISRNYFCLYSHHGQKTSQLNPTVVWAGWAISLHNIHFILVFVVTGGYCCHKQHRVVKILSTTLFTVQTNCLACTRNNKDISGWML